MLYQPLHVYQTSWSYHACFLRHQVQQTDFFVIFGHFLFCSFTLLTASKNFFLKKWQKCLQISPFYTCVPQMTITWGMVPKIWSVIDRIFSHFRPFFALLPPPPPNNPENRNLEKMKKKSGYIIILHQCTINDNHMMYGSWDVTHNRTFCHFGPFFALLSP